MSYELNSNPNRDTYCDISPFAFVSVSGKEARFLEVEESSWGTSKANIVFGAEEPSDIPFLDSLRSAGTQAYVAYRTDVAICKVNEGTRLTRAGTQKWDISFKVETSDFTPSIEMAFSSTSANQLAEKRARRLLLNEDPFNETMDVRDLRGINELTKEIFVRGQGTTLAILRSPFPALFKQYRDTPDRFLRFAWIHAVFQLKLSASVAEILHFRLTLRGQSLDVDFHGRRKKAYVNVPPYEVLVRGTCNLGS